MLLCFAYRSIQYNIVSSLFFWAYFEDIRSKWCNRLQVESQVQRRHPVTLLTLASIFLAIWHMCTAAQQSQFENYLAHLDSRVIDVGIKDQSFSVLLPFFYSHAIVPHCEHLVTTDPLSHHLESPARAAAGECTQQQSTAILQQHPPLRSVQKEIITDDFGAV